MRLLAFEHYRTARASLRRARSRTLLTMLGVAIGVASITTILALGTGVTNIISKQVADIGNRVAVIRPIDKVATFTDLSNPTPQTAYSTSPISERDLEAVAEVPGVQHVAPIMTISGSVRTNDENPASSTILATTPEFSKTTLFELRDGQFIDTVTLENTAVIGEQLAVDLFGTNQAIGKHFFIRGETFTVIGVLKRQHNPVNYNNVDLDHAAVISLESGKLFNNGVVQIQQINVKAKSGISMTTLEKQLDTVLKKNHDGERDTTVLIGNEIARPTSKLFLLINGVMSLIAGISLLVGGIGIMNIMLVSVTERTREIGLRKAVGASNSMIVMQFMIEALIISVVGGLLGYIGGYVIAFLVSLLLPYDPVFTWQIAVGAFGLSLGVGVLFGLYPAIRAARKDPIESLRRYH